MSKSIKTLWSFSVDKEVEKDEVVQAKNSEGEEITITKKVKIKEPQTFILRKPSRSEVEKGEFFYNKSVGQAIQGGLLPVALLLKRLSNDGGVLSEEEKNAWANKLNEKIEKEEKFKILNTKAAEDRSEEEKEAHSNLLSNITILNRELKEMEYAQNTLMGTTAESTARSKTLVWWLLLLLNKQEKESFIPVFKGNTDVEREQSYDDFLDEDSLSETEREFLGSVAARAYRAVHFWYFGYASKQEEFDELFSKLDN